MYKLKNGSLRTIIYNKADLDLYIQAGWSLIEDEKKEEPKQEKKKAQKEEDINEQDSPKGNTNKK